jgi:hypothetical protein
MGKNKSTVTPIIITVILGTLGSLLIGLAISGTRIFNIHQVVFQYIGSAIIASVFYSMLTFSSRRNAFLILAMLFILFEAIERNFEFFYLLRNVLYFADIAAAVFIYSEFILPKIKELKFGKFLAFTSLYASFGAILGFILTLIHKNDTTFAEVVRRGYEDISFQFLIGLGIGLGLEIAQLITPPQATSVDNSATVLGESQL